MNAKEWINRINEHPEWNKCELEEPAISEITELVERDTARTPIEEVLYEDKHHRVLGYICPNCCEKYTSILHNFCGNCGQRFKR